MTEICAPHLCPYIFITDVPFWKSGPQDHLKWFPCVHEKKGNFPRLVCKNSNAVKPWWPSASMYAQAVIEGRGHSGFCIRIREKCEKCDNKECIKRCPEGKILPAISEKEYAVFLHKCIMLARKVKMVSSTSLEGRVCPTCKGTGKKPLTQRFLQTLHGTTTTCPTCKGKGKIL
jgi:hypothetical protein